jgi:hypothetical protein
VPVRATGTRRTWRAPPRTTSFRGFPAWPSLCCGTVLDGGL